MRRFYWLVIFFMIVPCVQAETIRLKTGQVIKATILERRDDAIKVDLQGVKLTYYLDTVESIENDVRPVTTIPQDVQPSVVSVSQQSVSVPQKNEQDIKLTDYVQVDYGPGEDLSNIKVDPTFTLNALGLKVDENQAIVPNKSAMEELFSTRDLNVGSWIFKILLVVSVSWFVWRVIAKLRNFG